MHQSSTELEAAIYRYLDVTNEDPKPFVWTKTADLIPASVARFCQCTLDTGHWLAQLFQDLVNAGVWRGRGSGCATACNPNGNQGKQARSYDGYRERLHTWQNHD